MIIPIPLLPGSPDGFPVAWPDDLGVGTHESVIAPTLLFHAIAAIEHLILGPAVSENHGNMGEA
jgi:hypothetical protein